MNQKATRKITPAAVRLLALDAVRGAVIGMLIGTGGSKVLLAAALPERKLNLLHRPFAKVGKAALMLYHGLQRRPVVLVPQALQNFFTALHKFLLVTPASGAGRRLFF